MLGVGYTFAQVFAYSYCMSLVIQLLQTPLYTVVGHALTEFVGLYDTRDLRVEWRGTAYNRIDMCI